MTLVCQVQPEQCSFKPQRLLAVLCCAVPCCAVPCRAVLCRAVLCCAVLCCAVLCCAVLCCAVPCCAVPCRAVLCCALLCRAVLCCDVMCSASAMLCHAVLCLAWQVCMFGKCVGLSVPCQSCRHACRCNLRKSATFAWRGTGAPRCEACHSGDHPHRVVECCGCLQQNFPFCLTKDGEQAAGICWVCPVCKDSLPERLIVLQVGSLPHCCMQCIAPQEKLTSLTLETLLCPSLNMWWSHLCRETPHVVSAAAGAGKGYSDQRQ